jgi:hypothetical protein
MKAFLDGLVRRRTALVERAAAQRGAVAAALAELRSASATPLLLGVGVASTLLAASPKLRGWAVKSWAIYAFVRGLFGR